jgi:prepilin-type N-terminal cleavage/methylation domain-containing protein
MDGLPNFVRRAVFPVRGRRGLTLMELLAVICIVGILSAVAAPRYARARDQAYLVTLQADLNELRIAQEAYRTSDGHFEYAADLEHLGDRFVAGEGVTVEILASGPNGWAAEARHARTPVRAPFHPIGARSSARGTGLSRAMTKRARTMAGKCSEPSEWFSVTRG